MPKKKSNSQNAKLYNMAHIPKGVYIQSDCNTIESWKNTQESVQKEYKKIEKNLKIYNILLDNKIDYYKDIEQIHSKANKKLLYSLGEDIYNYLPKIGFEKFEEIAFPILNDRETDEINLKDFLKGLILISLDKDVEDAKKQELSFILEDIVQESENYNAVKQYTIYSAKKNVVIAEGILPSIEKEDIQNFIYIKYYQWALDKINKDNWKECLVQNQKQILKENSEEKYRRDIWDYEFSLNFKKQLLNDVNLILRHNQRRQGVLRPNSYYDSQRPFKGDLTINEIANIKDNQNKILNLLKETSFDEYEKLKKVVKTAEDENEGIKQAFNTCVSILIGKKLSRHASMAFKATCALAYREYTYQNIKTLSDRIEIKSSDFWDLCNVKKTYKGYDSKSKNIIRDAIANELKETIFYKDRNSFFITSFVLKFEVTKNNTCIFQIEDMFLVAEDAEDYSYYSSDLEGCNRLMDKTNNSEKAYWLHHYLEHSIKKGEHEFNVSTLLKAADLSDKYFKERKKTESIKILNQILDAMISERTLIYKREHLVSNSDPAGKYILSNLRLKDKIVSIKSRKNSKKK